MPLSLDMVLLLMFINMTECSGISLHVMLFVLLIINFYKVVCFFYANNALQSDWDYNFPAGMRNISNWRWKSHTIQGTTLLVYEPVDVPYMHVYVGCPYRVAVS